MALIQTFAPHDDESGFGYYRRLAAANALFDWRELAVLAGVGRSRDALMGQPEDAARALGLEPDWARSAAEGEQRCRAWKGLHRRTADALCPQCLSEAAYIRREWEHAYVTACPAHRLQLVDRCDACGEWLDLHRQRIEQCACGHDLRESSRVSATPGQVWLSALLASQGGSSAGFAPQVRGADTQALCELVATLCRYFDVTAQPIRRHAAKTKSVGESARFLAPLDALLQDWPRAFEAHVEARIRGGNPNARTLNTLLGPWYAGVKKACQGNALEGILEAVIRVAARTFDGVLGLDTAKAVVEDVTEHVRLVDAARMLGVSRDRLLDAVKAGVCLSRTRRFGKRGHVYEIPRAEVERIGRQRQAWVSEESACAMAQVPVSVLQHMAVAGVIVTDAKWRHDIHKGGPIQRESLNALFEAIQARAKPQPTNGQELVTWAELTSRRMGDKQAIQSVMRAAAAGEVVAVQVGSHLGRTAFLRAAVAPYFGTPLLEAGMSIQQLATFTGWKWESIAHWVNLGLLQAQQIQLRGQPCQVVSPQQLLTFRQTFIPLADLARAMGTKPSALSEQLVGVDIVGAKPLPNGLKRGGLVRVADLGRLAVAGAKAREAAKTV